MRGFSAKVLILYTAHFHRWKLFTSKNNFPITPRDFSNRPVKHFIYNIMKRALNADGFVDTIYAQISHVSKLVGFTCFGYGRSVKSSLSVSKLKRRRFPADLAIPPDRILMENTRKSSMTISDVRWIRFVCLGVKFRVCVWHVACGVSNLKWVNINRCMYVCFFGNNFFLWLFFEKACWFSVYF